MEKIRRMSAEILEAASLEQLRECRDFFNAAWKRKIDERIAGLTNSRPGDAWPMEAPASPHPTHPSPWTTLPGTRARHEEEEEAMTNRWCVVFTRSNSGLQVGRPEPHRTEKAATEAATAWNRANQDHTWNAIQARPECVPMGREDPAW